MARVGGVGAVQRPKGGAVVGKGQVHLAIDGIDGGPLGAIHRRRPDGIRCQPGVDQDIGLVSEDVSRSGSYGRPGRNLAEDQRQPCPGPIRVEAGHIEGTGIEVLVPHGQTVGYLSVTRLPDCVRDELVEVLRSGVVAHVDHHLLTRDHPTLPGALMVEPAKGRALARGRRRIEGVHLYDPTKLVWLVAIVGRGAGPLGPRVPADEHRARGLRRGPTVIARCAGHAITAQCRQLAGATSCVVGARSRIVPPEVAGPVLLAGQQGAPGCVPVGAVIDRSAAFATRWGEDRDHRRRPPGGPMDRHRRIGRDHPVEGAFLHVGPSPITGGIPHLDETHAVGFDFLLRLRRRAGAVSVDGRAVGMQVLDAQVLVVLGQDASHGAVVVTRAACAQPEVVEGVAMVADALRVVRVGPVVLEGRNGGGNGVSKRGHHRDGVARGDSDHIREVLWHREEGQLRRADGDDHFVRGH